MHQCCPTENCFFPNWLCYGVMISLVKSRALCLKKKTEAFLVPINPVGQIWQMLSTLCEKGTYSYSPKLIMAYVLWWFQNLPPFMLAAFLCLASFIMNVTFVYRIRKKSQHLLHWRSLRQPFHSCQTIWVIEDENHVFSNLFSFLLFSGTFRWSRASFAKLTWWQGAWLFQGSREPVLLPDCLNTNKWQEQPWKWWYV